MHAIHSDPDGALRWAEAPDPIAGPGELVVRVAACGVNRADLLQRRGLYPPPHGASPILGLEAAGEVLELGPGVQGWTAGAPCMALLAGGGYAQRVAVDARHVLPLPPGVDPIHAAALMEAFVTAYLNLVVLGELKVGERVLIHGGSGGVGTAAIQLANALDAAVWASARGSKAEQVRALGATQTFDYLAPDFAAQLHAAGHFDVVLDVLGAKGLSMNLELLAPDGRLLLVGLLGGRRAEVDLLPILSRRLTVRGSTLRALPAERKAELIAAFARDVLPLFADGRLRPLVDRSFPIAEADAAHARMQAGEHVGKLVLEVPA
ncbi:MAG: NAD(P)H-quinone oxidoreductase [Planctomycetes bacterium]|nr:NAD(P)H-quinone oxidoreductase [Planctomycetota bacterium]